MIAPRILKRCSLAVISLGLLGMAASSHAQVSTSAETLITWYKPPVMDKWQIQLQGTIDTTYNADIYDIDLFDSSTTLIQQLHSTGKHVVCYFSAGSSENWRPDSKQFLPTDMGKSLSGWPGEKWLDTRSQNVRRIMTARMDLAKSKGCDGIDPDNVDGYTNKPGVPLTAATQLDYNTFLATQAHNRGLAIGLKNNMAQVKSLVTYFDFIVNEQCFRYGECSTLTPFISAGKPVFNIEYQKKYVTNHSRFHALCKASIGYKFSTLVLPSKLNGKYRLSCL